LPVIANATSPVTTAASVGTAASATPASTIGALQLGFADQQLDLVGGQAHLRARLDLHVADLDADRRVVGDVDLTEVDDDVRRAAGAAEVQHRVRVHRDQLRADKLELGTAIGGARRVAEIELRADRGACPRAALILALDRPVGFRQLGDAGLFLATARRDDERERERERLASRVTCGDRCS
jgi:hypothetical protein